MNLSERIDDKLLPIYASGTNRSETQTPGSSSASLTAGLKSLRLPLTPAVLRSNHKKKIPSTWPGIFGTQKISRFFGGRFLFVMPERLIPYRRGRNA